MMKKMSMELLEMIKKKKRLTRRMKTKNRVHHFSSSSLSLTNPMSMKAKKRLRSSKAILISMTESKNTKCRRQLKSKPQNQSKDLIRCKN